MIISDGQHTLTDVDKSTEDRKILQEWRANIIALADVGRQNLIVSLRFKLCLRQSEVKSKIVCKIHQVYIGNL